MAVFQSIKKTDVVNETKCIQLHLKSCTSLQEIVCNVGNITVFKVLSKIWCRQGYHVKFLSNFVQLEHVSFLLPIFDAFAPKISNLWYMLNHQ